jgi:hypothetical protein
LKSLDAGINSATVNQVRLVLHTAAFWLMHGVRAAIPPTSPPAGAEFATIRDRLIKIGARVIEHIARIRIQLPTSCPEGALFRTVALRPDPARKQRGVAPQTSRRPRQINPERVVQRVASHRSSRSDRQCALAQQAGNMRHVVHYCG